MYGSNVESELFNPQIKNYVIEVTSEDSSGRGFDASIDRDDDNIIGKIKTFGTIEKKLYCLMLIILLC